MVSDRFLFNNADKNAHRGGPGAASGANIRCYSKLETGDEESVQIKGTKVIGTISEKIWI